jgi:osmotically-inducible protein OsmY
MFRHLRRAAAAGITACALGLTPGPAASGALEARPAQAAQAEASKVEHAWMSHPGVFALSLEVRVNEDDALEVHGKVPDQATRQLALKLARQATCSPVQDCLTVTPPGAKAIRGRGAMRAAALSQIRARLGPAASRIEVAVAEDGVIELHGTAATLEDRHAASRCLRGLPGITRVESYIEVHRPAQASGRASEVRSVSAQSLPAADGRVARAAVQEESAGPELSPLPSSASPRGEAGQATPTTQALTTGPGNVTLPAPPIPRMPTYVPANPYVHLHTRPVAIEPSPRGAVASPVVGFAQPAYPGLTPTGGGVQLSVAQLEGAPTFLDRVANLLAAKPRPRESGIRIQAIEPTPAPPLAPATPPPPAKAPELPKPSPVHVTAWPPAHRVSNGQPQASRVTPASLAGSGQQPIPLPPPPPGMTGALASTPTPAEARRIALKACGKKALSVQASQGENGKLILQVHAAPRAEQEVTSTLLALPELQGSNVHIQIHVSP